jgi:hypothetical protein
VPRKPAPKKPTLSPALEVELRNRLEEVLDEIDDVADKRRRLSKKLGGYLKVLAETRDLVRRQLKGQDLDQMEIPGTEKPEPARDPLVQEILKIAGGIVEKPKEDTEEIEQLFWVKSGDNLVASVTGGTYAIEPLTADGRRPCWWTPVDGWSKRVGDGETLDQAKEIVRKHHRERIADEMLKNAGSENLTRADTKGDAVARKKGGGRG